MNQARSIRFVEKEKTFLHGYWLSKWPHA
jgi:hypothetical protein